MKLSDCNIQCLETNELILPLKKSWEELHKDCTQPSIHNSFNFINESFQAFQCDDTTKKITLTDINTGQLIAIFPFKKRKISWKYIPYNTYETTALNEIMDKPFTPTTVKTPQS